MGQELFICYWVAFNALYGRVNENAFDPQRKRRYLRLGDDDTEWFLERICDLDSGGERLRAALDDVDKDARALLKSRYLFEDYWRWGYTSQVKKQLHEEADAAKEALERGDLVSYVKTLLWGRIRVLRNQIFHGGSSNQGSGNTDTLEPALNVLRALVPLFVDIMASRPDKSLDWPKLPFPRKGSPQNLETRARRH